MPGVRAQARFSGPSFSVDSAESTDMDLGALLSRLVRREDLRQDEMRSLLDAIMDGQVAPPVITAILAALATKGETVEELIGAAQAMRARVTPVRAPPGVNAVDTCGTGGDGRPTFNVSTAVALVAAAGGVTVAKHGNRSNARPSGSAEVLAALGVNIAAGVATLERCLRDCRIAFLHAARLHPAMSVVAPLRRQLGIRTIFNWVGPLTNPAGVRLQMMGVPRPELVEQMATALRALGAERAVVVHGREGLCDLSLTGPSLIARLEHGRIALEEVTCAQAGLPPAPLEALFVNSPEQSAAVIRGVLAGQPGAARDMVLWNAAAVFRVAGMAADWAAGARLAAEAIDTGRAADTLQQLVTISNEDAGTGAA